MKIDKLLECIGKKDVNLDFEFDQVGQTWGSSYIRLTIGSTGKFHSAENFFFSCFKSEQSLEQEYAKGNGRRWIQRANLSNWASGLSIESVDGNRVLNFIEDELKQQEGGPNAPSFCSDMPFIHSDKSRIPNSLDQG